MADDNEKKEMVNEAPRNLKTSNFEGSGHLDEEEEENMMSSEPLRKKKKKVLEPCSESLIEKCSNSSQSLKVSESILDEEARNKLAGSHDDDQVVVYPEDMNTSFKRVLIDHDKAKSFTLQRAKELQAHLDPQFPSFVKSLVASHVSGWFVLRTIPSRFCKTHLPKENTMISLMDENQKIYPVKYLVDGRFSGGWRGFSIIAHKLVEGDALVFQLVKPAQFQVYIIRAHSIAEIDEVSDLLKQIDSCKNNLEVESASFFVGEPIPEEEASNKLLLPYNDDKVALDQDDVYTSRKSVLIDHNKVSCAMQRAKEFQAHLDPGFPSFVKSMVASHVSGWFILGGIPSRFCKTHLPKENALISLIDENQVEFPVKYLVDGRFSGGWKGFSVAHNLVEGDALVFRLVKPTQFQVYITRAYSISEIDGSGLLEQTDSCKQTKKSEITAERLADNLLSVVLPQPTRDSRRNNEEAGLEVLRGTSVLEPIGDFEDIKSLESFTVVVNGAVIDSQLSEEEKSKYYELCCSQQCGLHVNLVDGLNSRLAAGIIAQTISIADAIRATKLSTSEEEFAEWDNKLNAFKLLGMNVAFLQARVKTLASFVRKNLRTQRVIGKPLPEKMT